MRESALQQGKCGDFMMGARALALAQAAIGGAARLAMRGQQRRFRALRGIFVIKAVYVRNQRLRGALSWPGNMIVKAEYMA